MVELAIAGNPAFAASRIELDRAGPSYTVDTLEALAAETAGPDAHPVGGGVPRAADLARAAPRPRPRPARRRAARRVSRGRPGVPRRALPGVGGPGGLPRRAAAAAVGLGAADPGRRRSIAPLPRARMRSPTISATMRCIDPPGGMTDRDRTRAPGEADPQGPGRHRDHVRDRRPRRRSPRPRPRRPRPPSGRRAQGRRPAAPRDARARSPSGRRSSSPVASSSSPRTRRRPTSCCST